MFESLKKKLAKYLEALAQQNQKQFGTHRMDCCEMNKHPKPHK